MQARLATIQDHGQLTKFYSCYYPSGHPLYNQNFWAWMFTNPAYGQCIVVENEAKEIIGHMGCIQAGGLVWLVNILVDTNYRKQNIPDILFDAARQFGPLAVAVANDAGASLLRRKKWHEQPLLQRWIWTRPNTDFQNDPDFFTTKQPPVGLQKPNGYLWQQPHLQSVAFSWGDIAQLALSAGGLRLVTCNDPKACVAWAMEHGCNWIDFVTSDTNAAMQIALQDALFFQHENFPWYLNPPDFSRKVTLNWFTENPLPEGFIFDRSMADMTRIGSID